MTRQFGTMASGSTRRAVPERWTVTTFGLDGKLKAVYGGLRDTDEATAYAEQLISRADVSRVATRKDQ